MNLESMYQEIILDHYKHPLNKGLLPKADKQVHHVNPTCGDEITLQVIIKNHAVAGVHWEGQGCSISQASSSVMSDLVSGLPVSDALALGDEFLAMMQGSGASEELGDGVAFEGVAKYPARVKCALLGWMALKDAVLQVESGEGERS